MFIKLHISSIWSSNHKKVKQHWGWVEKSVTYEKKKHVTDFFIPINNFPESFSWAPYKTSCSLMKSVELEVAHMQVIVIALKPLQNWSKNST